ncbi:MULTISPECIES: multidrug DMT transporter permease [unclassified Burkholderia]|uniref:multidrug DMT transporter permease n=1 Tax=unclassified Burkholderia TaxID=2613784 RepID=UPI00141FCA36|nr:MULTISPECIES: multidrug DMT transporter permease [unclassified Burkholderia]NIE59781.1 multidrug DMT transporter permease [Burkholderia sp. Ap-955]NIF11190.1 multidrug DMT transporter permease [Burkholderia sp. Ax-1735]NIG04889.1 multidrug DMT transporter permease [Burkholderia sp. Tr-849]
MSLDLEILIARLRWPIASTRWWAMQELAALLLSPETQEEVEKQLMMELARCRLEAETVEVICVFWMAARQGYTPPSNFASIVSHPSLLAALLLSDMGRMLSTAPNPPLEMVPEHFKAPARFRELQGFDVPPIYFTRLAQLERESGLPFVRQCAFEWSRTEGVYPNAPLQGDLAFFVRPVGDGMAGAFAARAMLRMLTAYQRTLDVARAYGSMPDEAAVHFAVDALPVDPTLAFLRPVRPSWLPALGKQVTADSTSVETFIRSALTSLAAAEPKAVLLSLVSPTYADDKEIVELSVVRWRRWGATAVDARDLAARFFDRQKHWGYGTCQSPGWGMTTFVPVADLESVLDHDANAAPMAAVYGFDRIGYLQRDLYPTRLYYPVATGLDSRLTVEPRGGELQISSANGPIATASYWNAAWSPVHPAAMCGFCGTALVGTADSLQAQSEPPPDGHFYLWQVSRLQRSNGHEPFVAGEPECGVLFI